MSQRAYCDRDHPGSDDEADRWCEWYHRPIVPTAPTPGLNCGCECTRGGFCGGCGHAGCGKRGRQTRKTETVKTDLL